MHAVLSFESDSSWKNEQKYRPAKSLSWTVRSSVFVEVCCCHHENQGTTNNSPHLQFRKNCLHRSKKVFLFSSLWRSGSCSYAYILMKNVRKSCSNYLVKGCHNCKKKMKHWCWKMPSFLHDASLVITELLASVPEYRLSWADTSRKAAKVPRNC